ncbi:DNA replication/repair protein RecF [Candidatus Beckwithbacteria bacterium]|nr:DNA replication/repair protein RecF [Candidatus Beckwithbacteria bacterium]
MRLQSLQLHNFRSYTQQSFAFSKNAAVLIGPNAIGKTNVVEAVTLLAIGKSFRAGRDEEMVHFGEDFGRVSADVDGQSLEIVLTRGQWQGKKVAKKRFLLSGVAKRRKDFIGRLKIVLFQPQDIDLVLGSPSRRRDYLDMVLSQIDSEYDRSLLSYQKGVRQRNKLLTAISEGRAKISQLEFWDRLLAKDGEIISQKRADYLDFLNRLAAQASFRHQLLGTNGNDDLLPEFSFAYKPNRISLQRLKNHQAAEVATGVTLVGPHRDDFTFMHQHDSEEPTALATYGSRGEQRMSVLALKLGELTFVKTKTQEEPVLLLDDIFSELDHPHQEIVLRIIGKQQTIMTTTDLKLFGKKMLADLQVIQL